MKDCSPSRPRQGGQRLDRAGVLQHAVAIEDRAFDAAIQQHEAVARPRHPGFQMQPPAGGAAVPPGRGDRGSPDRSGCPGWAEMASSAEAGSLRRAGAWAANAAGIGDRARTDALLAAQRDFAGLHAAARHAGQCERIVAACQSERIRRFALPDGVRAQGDHPGRRRSGSGHVPGSCRPAGSARPCRRGSRHGVSRSPQQSGCLVLDQREPSRARLAPRR